MPGWRPLHEAPRPTEVGERIRYLVWDQLLDDAHFGYVDSDGFWSGNSFNYKEAYRPRLYLALDLQPSPEELVAVGLKP